MNDYSIPRSDSAKQSNLAPSEKHLEDWIDANFGLFRQTYEDGKLSPNKWIDSIVARQPRFTTGRPDLIAISGTSLIVIELKKGAITSDSILQCLRYQWDLMQIVIGLCMRASYELPWTEINQLAQRHVRGMVVGSSFDSNLLPGLEVANLSAVTYEYHDGSYKFSGWYYDGLTDWHDEQLDTAIGRNLTKLMVSEGFQK